MDSPGPFALECAPSRPVRSTGALAQAAAQSAPPPPIEWVGMLHAALASDDAARRRGMDGALIAIGATLQFAVAWWAGWLTAATSAYMSAFAALCILHELSSAKCDTLPASPLFPFGFHRLCVLVDFCVLLIAGAAACMLGVEAIERVVDRDSLGGPRLGAAPLVVIAQLLVLGAQARAFGIQPALLSLLGSRRVKGQHVHNTMPGLDAAREAAMLACGVAAMHTVLLRVLGWRWLDTLGALGAAGGFLLHAHAPLVESARVLLQTVPHEGLMRAVREVLTQEAVLEVREAHFWAVAPDLCVGSLCVRVRHDAHEAAVLEDVRALFPRVALTVEIDKDGWII